MTVGVTVLSPGIKGFEAYLAQLPAVTRQSARIAINTAADTARKKIIPEHIMAEVAFPPGYLDDDEKLAVYKRATDNDLEAIVIARERPTSLARFSLAGSPGAPNPGGIPVQVKPGKTITLKRAFLVRLRSGASLTADNFNVGLAVRLKPGQTLRHKHTFSAVQLADDVYILYAPSVDQVFKTVAEDVNEELGEMVETEFFRQFVRLSDAV